MIKINLLGVPAPSAKSRAQLPAGGIVQAAVFAGALLVCFGTVGLFYKIWNWQIDTINVEITKQRAEQARLAAIKAENLKYEQERQLLELRIHTIQVLQSKRVGPTEFMNALADVVNKTTRDLYLFSVGPVGERLAMRGQADSVYAVAALLHTLKASGHFEDVQLRQFYEDDVGSRLSYKFNLDCAYKAPAAATSGTPPGATPVRQPGT